MLQTQIMHLNFKQSFNPEYLHLRYPGQFAAVATPGVMYYLMK